MNARALEEEGAARLVTDARCREEAMPKALELLADKKSLEAMSRNLQRLARPRAAEDIVDEILRLIEA